MKEPLFQPEKNRQPVSRSSNPAFFQPKLTVNQPNDVYEQEADDVANKVMPGTSLIAGQNSFKPVDGGLQRTEGLETAGQGTTELDSYAGSLQSTGQPLPQAARQFFEPRFGQDLSNVKVHTDGEAAKSAQSINALAYTTGNNIVFGKNEFAPETPSGQRLLAHELTHTLQQGSLSKGNDQQKSNFVQRQDAKKAPAITLTADEISARIARCVGIWETNRTHDDPAPKESGLDTVAGVHASMATIEQATMPYAVTALKGHKELWSKATPPLTKTELDNADKRCSAVVTLLTSVKTASDAGTTPDDFIKNNATAITDSGLTNADVKTMFSAVTLKQTIDTANTNVEAEKAKKPKEKDAGDKKLKEEIDAIKPADRLGLGEGSLKAYIRKPGNWGENRAGWQRKAVNNMADNVGARIESVATADNGTGLATPVIKDRVTAQLAKDPQPSLEDIITTVGQQNNPHEKDYGANILKNYQRLYP